MVVWQHGSVQCSDGGYTGVLVAVAIKCKALMKCKSRAVPVTTRSENSDLTSTEGPRAHSGREGTQRWRHPGAEGTQRWQRGEQLESERRQCPDSGGKVAGRACRAVLPRTQRRTDHQCHSNTLDRSPVTQSTVETNSELARSAISLREG